MDKIILLTAGVVVVINIIYNLLPDGSFNKYCRHILGLVLILIFLGTVTDVSISSEVLDFKGEIPVYNNEKIKEVIDNNTKKLIETKICEMLASKNIMVEDVYIEMSEGILTKVKVLTNNKEHKKIIEAVSSFCDIKPEDVVVE